MTHHQRKWAAACFAIASLSSGYTVAHSEAPNIQSVSAPTNTTSLWASPVSCHTDPSALSRAIYNSRWSIRTTRFVISGQCHGPIVIHKRDIEISNDAQQSGSIRLLTDSTSLHDQAPKEAVKVVNSTVELNNITIEVEPNSRAITVTQSSVVTLRGVASNVQPSSEKLPYPFVITDNSTGYISDSVGSGFEVSGSSVVEFNAGNKEHVVNVLDTSMARSVAKNQFESVQVSGNGYFLGDNKTHIESLMVWSKASAEVNRESSVAQLQMGGQTLFAAYRNSSITGPYFLYGNVVFELEHSTASNWVSVDKPQSILIGNNATVNGTLYPSWSWAGQDGNDP